MFSDYSELIEKAENVPNGLGQRIYLNQLCEDTIDLLKNDIKAVVAKTVLPENIKLEFFDRLVDLFDRIQAIAFPFNLQKSIHESFRLFNLVLENHFLNQCEPEFSNTIRDKLLKIQEAIGVVPRLNPVVKLPDKSLMPPQYFSKTSTGKKTSWDMIIWKDPRRGSAHERLEFISSTTEDGRRIAAVRQQLAQEELYEYQEEKTAVCYGCADFDVISNLHADHLQPAADILERQCEMLMAMNADPIFAKEMMSAEANQGYLLYNKNEPQYYGTKKFFMEYHNAVENVWFMHSGENAGGGKGGEEVITWLRNHPRFGQAFFAAVGPIQQQTILFCTEDGTLLAAKARRWFRQRYSEEITSKGFSAIKIDVPMQDAMKHMSMHFEQRPKSELNPPERKRRRKEKAKKVEFMANLSMQSVLASQAKEVTTKKAGGGSSSDDQSIPSDESAITPRNLEKVNKISMKFSSRVNQITDDIVSEYLEPSPNSPEPE